MLKPGIYIDISYSKCNWDAYIKTIHSNLPQADRCPFPPLSKEEYSLEYNSEVMDWVARNQIFFLKK